MSDTSTTIIGNVTRDPGLRYSNSGKPLAGFGVAVNHRRKNPDTGRWEDGDTSFFDITCFRELAENVASSVRKGQRVIVAGALKQRSWETDDGKLRSKVELIADDVGPSLKFATAQVERAGQSQPPAQPASYDDQESPF